MIAVYFSIIALPNFKKIGYESNKQLLDFLRVTKAS